MRAAVVRAFGGPEAVEIVDVELPEPGARQVRIKVTASALNPVDAGVRAGIFGGAGRQIGLGWDVAGTVDAVGPAAAWSVGEEVVALAHGVAAPLGAHAEYVVVDADAVALAPASVDAVHAATLPLNALTAVQALDLLDLAPGDSLLVTGGAGAVGGYAVEIAARRGVKVAALARAQDEEFVRSLGATRLVDGAGGADGADGSGGAGGFDAVLDAAVLGSEALAFVRDGGAYAGVIPQAQPAAERGVRTTAVEVASDGVRLAELVRAVDAGELTLRIAGTHALADAAEAHARLAEGGLRGRLVIVP
ncbi:NADP-dependent oxidoreductase [Streptomyces sp. MBT49]|uniref:NADP-dependent oxidoreductase n=1 Tax=Streptomyces sp. MBT49 TaxID=1488380 RepID=UPI00190A2A6C|nr:NADP-dependent oxidoreductase [Streptomyces sp. MBT49]MBK3628000.1 NADP-dependent oxidoreductase [Streptomyces sp. MBT49]